MLVLALASIVPSLLTLPPPQSLALAVLGTAYVLTATLGARRVERAPTALRLAALFTVQLGLAALAIGVSGGHAALIVLATVSEAVLYLAPLAAGAVITCALALAALALGLLAPDLAAAAQGLASVVAAAAFVIAFSVMSLRQHRARAEHARLAADLGRANEQLRRHAEEASALSAERERMRIAREMHDSAGHGLTVAHVQLEVAAAFLDTDRERARLALATAGRSLREALEDVRRSVSALREGAPSVPLTEGIEDLIRGAAASPTATGFRVEGTPRRLLPATELALFRVAQEALTNVHRHAHASRVEIVLSFADDGGVTLSVRDDGVGASGEPVADGGFGLQGMGERVAAIGGRLRLSGASGFRVDVEIPA